MKFTSEVIAKDILEEILSSPIPYNSAAEETLTKVCVEQLVDVDGNSCVTL